MSREIRRVPPDWEHPKYEAGEVVDPRNIGHYKPLYDSDYDSKAQQWISNLQLWQEGKHPDQANSEVARTCKYYWDWNGSPPNPEYYRTRAWTPEEATAYQIYETVSEGTPKSPVFPTVEAMHVWLLGEGYSERAATAFIEMGWVPSGLMVQRPDGTGAFATGIAVAGLMADADQDRE